MSTTPPAPQPSAPSYNQQMLTQIRAVLQGKLLDGVEMYKVGDRELTNMPLPDLQRAEAYYEARVRQELRRQKRLGQRFVPIVFGAADSWWRRFVDTVRECGITPIVYLGFWLLLAKLRLTPGHKRSDKDSLSTDSWIAGLLVLLCLFLIAGLIGMAADIAGVR